ncbi:hypothetical protein [Iodidimonas gelatinilytica]|nr:hypothetical protein [Iodidimonas gelatinilytica]
MSRMRQLLKLAVLGSLATLAACGSNKNPLEVTVQRCPALAVVGGTGSYTRFIGEEKNAADIAYEASISNLSLDCDQGRDVVSDVSFTIAAMRGPALPATGDVSLRWFVAVVRDNSEIVAKDIYDTRLHFEADQQRAISRETIRQILPTIEQARRYDYEILIGFQLDAQDVRYNLLR